MKVTVFDSLSQIMDRIVLRTLVLGAVSMTSAVYAATYTWDGGGTDDNWSTGDNWNPNGSVPVSASDTLVKLDGITRVKPVQDVGADFVLNRLEYLNGPAAGGKAAFDLSGQSFRFVANGTTQPRIYLTRQAACELRNDFEIPSGTTLFMDITTYGVNLRGVISGEGGIEKLNNAGGISLFNPDNSFSGGLLIRAVNDDWRKVNVYGSGAMGTGPVSLYGGTLNPTKTSPGGLIFYGSTVQTNPITLFAHSPIFAGMPPANSDAVTLNGPVDLSSYILHLRGGGSGTIGGEISEGGATALMKLDRGTWTLAGDNSFTGAVLIANGVLRTGAPDVFDPAVPIAVACDTGWNWMTSATLDLNGFNQSVSQLSGTPLQSSLKNILTSASPATLTVNQSGNTLFVGELAGAVSLLKAGAGTLTLSNALSTTTGTITVDAGTLAVAAAGSLSGSSTLAITSGGAKIAVAAGITEPVLKLFLGGVAQTSGTYGASGSGAEYENDDYFEGGGVIFVQRGASVTWDGGGTDALLSTPENWVGDTAPLFKWDEVTFGTGGLTAVVDRAVSLYGMTFNRDANFVVAAGDGVITNGAGGILAQSPSTTGRTYSIAEEIVLAASQEWCVTNTSGTTALTVTGPIRGDAGSALAKTGYGNLTLSGDNSFEGVLTATLGDLIVTHSNALGSASGKTVVLSGNGAVGSRGAQLVLRGGITLSEPLEVSGVGDGGFNGVIVNADSHNVLEGPVTLLGSARFQAYGSSGSLRFRGGITGNATFAFAYGNAIVEGVPLTLGSGWLQVHSGTLLILTSGHVWAASSIGWEGIVRAGAAHVLPTDKPFLMGSYDGNNVALAGKGRFDLNGFDQSIGSLGTDGSALAAGYGSGRLIWSAAPATLTVHQANPYTFDGTVTGVVSVVKEGSAQLTLTGANTTFGGFTVSNGTLRIGATGTLGANSTNVVAAGGTLSLAHSQAVSDQATLQILSGSMVHLDGGVEESVAWLTYGGTPRRSGTYGSTESPATYQDNTRFSGSGVLRVLRDRSGTLILLL
ncbi:autotransporter-associated beta strand repeat-containing protein [bacterium]|nr:autotransporter-associated beta strand repeat-containing protein [bacterium]